MSKITKRPDLGTAEGAGVSVLGARRGLDGTEGVGVEGNDGLIRRPH